MQRLVCIILLFFAVTSHAATRYVNPSHSNSRDSGIGSSTAPYKTISFAMKQLVSGDRLVIAAGTYRETLQFKYQASNVIVEGSGGTVVKGSDVVTGWQSAGGGVFVRRNWTVNSQQVFVNGTPYQQIGGTISGYPSGAWPGRVNGNRSSMTPNSFYYDAANDSLYIKPADGSISGKTVEASVRQRIAVASNVNNVQLRNITFMHSNTSASTQGAAVLLVGNRITVDRVSVLRADAVCLAVTGDNNTISNSVANYCGIMGMAVRGRYVKITNNETSYNNVRGFSQDWGAGGIKCISPGGSSPGGIKDSEIRGHRALYNKGDGIWLDSNPGGGNRILESIAAYNRYGIHFEISNGVQIYNNLVFGNSSRGIYIAGSSNALVAHNLSVKNGIDNISVSNSRNSGSTLAPKNAKVIGNVAAWPVAGILRLPDRDHNPASNGNLFVDDQASQFAQERDGTYAARASGISPWRSLSSQDGGSWERTTAAPSTIASPLNGQQANISWSTLKSMASQYRAPATPLDGGLPPGPLENMW
jgi:parallel beta-helix repeat protein